MPTDQPRFDHRPDALRRLLRIAVLSALPGVLAAIPVLASAPVQVFAEFASAAGASGVREARLFIDGQEVTGAAAVSPVRISYALPGDFPTGTHEARVVVVDSLGRSHEKSWSFEVAEQRPELVAWFTDELVVELDRLPRRTMAERLRVSGRSLPEVEVELRREGLLLDRATTSASGRFAFSVLLASGDNDLSVAAQRPWTGEEGREVRVRLERLVATSSVDEPPFDDPRDAEQPGARQGRGGPDAPDAPGDRDLPGEDGGLADPRVADTPPASSGRGGRDAPDPPDREPPDDQVDAEVIITKPGEGDLVRNGKVTVLGRAPAGWTVLIRVNGQARGSDEANPAGHFTVPQVRLDAGENRLVAEAESPGGTRLSSVPVVVEAPPAALGLAFTTRPRRSETVRAPAWRLEGRTQAGAELEVEVNGRLVLTDFAGFDGRFDLLVPLEGGLNRVVVEVFDPTSGRSERSRPFTLRRVGRPLRGEQPIGGLPPLERPAFPGRGDLGRLRPLR